MPSLKTVFQLGQLKEFIRGNFLNPYFCFWSYLYLRRWRPRVIVITGTVGKTSLLYLLKDQFAPRAFASERANTKIGITLQMLDLGNTVNNFSRWFKLLLLVPFRALRHPVRPESIYLVEYDIYDMYSARYFAWWLKPEATIWLSATAAHLQLFDKPASRRKISSFELMSRQLLKVVQSANSYIFALADNQIMRRALANSATPVIWAQIDLKDYLVDKERTIFEFKQQRFVFSHPLPPAMAQSLALLKAVSQTYQLPLKTNWRSWRPPLSRNQVLAGYKGCYLLDSTYNAQLAAMITIFKMFKSMPATSKWLICGDMLEQGRWTATAHRHLAEAIADLKPNRLFLVGWRIKQYTVPILESKQLKFEWRARADQSLVDDLKRQIKGGELLLFKGAGYLGIIVESLLANAQDRIYLSAPNQTPSGKLKAKL